MFCVKTLAAVSAAFLIGASLHQTSAQPTRLDAAGLKTMLEGLGNDVKVINAEVGKEKYEVIFKTEHLNIPVAAELSGTGNYIWITAFLGANSEKTKHEALLKENYNLQPTFFYITGKGNLMAGQPIDNRSVSAKDLKRCIDKLTSDIDKTQSTWSN